jgi:hypothetical protein
MVLHRWFCRVLYERKKLVYKRMLWNCSKLSPSLSACFAWLRAITYSVNQCGFSRCCTCVLIKLIFLTVIVSPIQSINAFSSRFVQLLIGCDAAATCNIRHVLYIASRQIGNRCETRVWQNPFELIGRSRYIECVDFSHQTPSQSYPLS